MTEIRGLDVDRAKAWLAIHVEGADTDLGFELVAAGGSNLTYNDSIFSDPVAEMIDQIGIEPRRTAFRSPWQNGIAERWVGSARRELLDDVIGLNEDQLRRLPCHHR